MNDKEKWWNIRTKGSESESKRTKNRIEKWRQMQTERETTE